MKSWPPDQTWLLYSEIHSTRGHKTKPIKIPAWTVEGLLRPHPSLGCFLLLVAAGKVPVSSPEWWSHWHEAHALVNNPTPYSREPLSWNSAISYFKKEMKVGSGKQGPREDG